MCIVIVIQIMETMLGKICLVTVSVIQLCNTVKLPLVMESDEEHLTSAMVSGMWGSTVGQ